MKLSAAIRIGSMTTRQITYSYTDGGNGRCALGAAMDAVGLVAPAGNIAYDAISGMTKAFPLLDLSIVHPIRGESPWFCVGNVIPNLNDGYEWSRDQIADWVEGIENAIEAKQEPKLVVKEEVNA